MIILKKIISGGQTGADQGALEATKQLNLETGGWMPRGFRTEAGSRIEFAKLYNLQETESHLYPPRTWNVCQSDGTLIFGNSYSPGCILTRKFVKNHGKALIEIAWFNDPGEQAWQYPRIKFFTDWLEENKIQTLNVAGNRESKNPGIQVATKDFLIQTLKGY